MFGYSHNPPKECFFCTNSTSGRFTLRGEFVCGKCWDKYEVIPVHIPLDQILRYHYAIEKKRIDLKIAKNKRSLEVRKKRLDKALLNLTQINKNSIM